VEEELLQAESEEEAEGALLPDTQEEEVTRLEADVDAVPHKEAEEDTDTLGLSLWLEDCEEEALLMPDHEEEMVELPLLDAQEVLDSDAEGVRPDETEATVVLDTLEDAEAEGDSVGKPLALPQEVEDAEVVGVASDELVTCREAVELGDMLELTLTLEVEEALLNSEAEAELEKPLEADMKAEPEALPEGECAAEPDCRPEAEVSGLELRLLLSLTEDEELAAPEREEE
jgi:hypothetical protein